MNIRASTAQQPRNAQRGISLLEVLVALIVFSLGCLLVAGLQGSSQRANYDAQQRLIATFLVNEIIEKMRTNPGGLASYKAVGSTAITGTRYSAEPTKKCKGASVCTAAELADHDLWEWERSINGAAVTKGVANTEVGGLLQPTGCINPVDGKVQVVLSWISTDGLSDSGKEAGGVDSCGAASTARRQIVVNTFIR